MKDLELLSWIARGSQRREIIRVMTGIKIPAQIYQESVKHNPKITRNSVSDVLRSFKKEGVAVCINEDAKKGRFWKLTSLGEKLRKKLYNLN